MKMNDLITALVREIHSRKSILPHFKIAATGGGSLFQSCFALTPGISSVLAGNVYPYSEKETISYLGFRPEKLASEECALELAMKAYQDAAEYRQKTLGIGISCALATERELKGGERAFLAIFGEDREGKSVARILSFWFQAGEQKDFIQRRQCQEESIAVAGASLLFSSLKNEDLTDFTFAGKIRLSISNTLKAKKYSSIELENQILKRPYFSAHGGRKESVPDFEINCILFPCTANPPHDGHFEMARELESREYISSHTKVVFNLTFDPPHKKVVEPHEMLLRTKLIQEMGYDCLLAVGDGLFLDKIKRHKMHLMMGYDAFLNFLSKKFYPENQEFDFTDGDFTTKILEYPLCFFVFDRYSEIKQQLHSVLELEGAAKLNRWPENLLPLNQKLYSFLTKNVIHIQFDKRISSTQIRESAKENGN